MLGNCLNMFNRGFLLYAEKHSVIKANKFAYGSRCQCKLE